MSEPIVFFGSGPVAAESLRLLLEWADVQAVITKARPPHHKGAVPVLELAEAHQLNTFTVNTKSELNNLLESRPTRARVAILVDFGIIVSQEAIDYFELGIVNSHFSLLPEWRGADPITFSILSGQKQTGVSLMLLTAGMDEGPLLGQAAYAIEPTETTPSLTEALIDLSDHMLKEIIPLYIDGRVSPQPQAAVTLAASNEPTYSRKLTKADGLLDPEKPASVLEREIRAFIGWPGSKITLGDIEVIVTGARATTAPTERQPGEWEIVDNTKGLILYCGEGYLSLERLKPVGKKEMGIADFLRGYHARLRR